MKNIIFYELKSLPSIKIVLKTIDIFFIVYIIYYFHYFFKS